ncbi:MAG TPA: uroporphyrinogen decarboxylase family protein [Candidatus Nitrosocosmicus sp.]|nr:uroporphyrinogen decarboxylase family protein [Candidatus Nitrosocosmicus sp.]
MNSKERLLKCIKREPIDRVPISTYELVGWNSEAWENKEPSYRKLMDAIRELTDCIYMLDPEMKHKPHSMIEQEEWTEGESHFTKRSYHTPKGELVSLNRIDNGIHTTWTLKHMLEGIEDIDKLLSMPYEPPEIHMDRFFSEKDKLGEKGLMMISIGDPICSAAEFFEMGTFLMYAITDPDKIKYFLDALHERQMHDLRRILKHDVRDVIFRICGPEYATPPYLSPDYFHNYVTCYLMEICREIRAAGGIPRIHSHGKIRKVLDQFAMTDALGLDPVEPQPDGDISLGEVKSLYGDRFCLFGNIELKELEHSDKKQVDYLVRQAMNEGKEGGGFVLMPTAAPINTPLSQKTEENYLQMIESAHKYGRY